MPIGSGIPYRTRLRRQHYGHCSDEQVAVLHILFLLAAPVRVLPIVLAPRVLPEFCDAGCLDLLSAGLCMTAVLLVVFGMKKAARDGPGAAVGTEGGDRDRRAFVRRQLTTSEPMLDLRLFRLAASAPRSIWSRSSWLSATRCSWASISKSTNPTRPQHDPTPHIISTSTRSAECRCSTSTTVVFCCAVFVFAGSGVF